MLAVDIDKNDEKLDVIARGINRINKTIRTRRPKGQENRNSSLRLNELKNLKADIRDKIDVLKEIISHMEEAKDQVILKIKQLKRKIKNNPSKNPFVFKEYLEMQK